MHKLSIAELPISQRPRERLQTLGPSALSDQELLTIVLASGGKHAHVRTIAEHVLRCIDQYGTNIPLETLTGITGIGQTKATQLLAALEFSRRRIRPAGIRITKAADLVPLLLHLADRKQEHFVCTSLNGAHEVIATRTITVGLVNSCQVHPREVLSDPIVDRATAIIVAHNHPSGNLTPSSEDKALTARLSEAAHILGITLLDHIIFGVVGYLSFQEEGIMPEK